MRWPELNMAAGPVEVSHRTLGDMARPVMYHYVPAFIELFAHAESLLMQVASLVATTERRRAERQPMDGEP